MPHPVQLVVTDDLNRNRLTVFVRIILAVPHYVVFYLWSIAMLPVIVVAWLGALLLGRVPTGLHDFIASWLRYRCHVQAYLLLLGNPYPPFSGMEEYPVDLRIAPVAPQRRLHVLLRGILVIPALAMGSAAAVVGGTVAFLGWFAALLTGHMPKGLRDAGAWALRVDVQTQAYISLATDRYPRFSPTPEPDAEPGSV